MANTLKNPQPGPPLSEPSKPNWWLFLFLAATLAALWLWKPGADADKYHNVDYSVFFTWVEQGHVARVTIKGQKLEGQLNKPQEITSGGHRTIERFSTVIPGEDKDLLPTLRKQGVRIQVTTGTTSWITQLLLSLLPWVILIGVWIWLSRRAQRMMSGGGPLGGILKQRSRKFDPTKKVNVTFDDVAGLQAAKRDLQEIVEFLKRPERFQRLGGKVPRGVLLVGPPGTGKTLLARAVAGESGVPFYSISASEFIEMFVGVGAKRVRDLFDEAKKNAPAIIFIDEIDAVGRSRGAGLGGGHDEREQTLNQLLSEMDGFDRNDLTIVLAATNRPDVLDPALLRPGRFDRRVMVDRPEIAAREAILRVHCKGKPLADTVDLARVAANTPGFSGADLANLVNEAALNATRRGAEHIEADDFSAAFDKIVLGDPRETKLDPRERARVAVHESGHAIVAHFSDHAEPLNRVSIIPRGMTLGVTQQTPEGDRHLMTQPQLEAKLRTLMGGYAAERMVLDNVSTGAENDLKQATKIASKMVAHYGMSEKVGPIYHEHGAEHPFLGHKIATESGTSDVTAHDIETETRELLRGAVDQATSLLGNHRAELDKLVAALLETETLEGNELVALLGESHTAADAVPAETPALAHSVKERDQ